MINFTRAVKILNATYNKTELQTSLYISSRLFARQHKAFLLSQGISERYLHIANQKNLSKSALTELCAIPFSSKAIYKKFRGTLLEEIQLLLDEIVWIGKLYQREIENRYDISIYTVTTRQLWNNYQRTEATLKEQFKFFKSENTAGWYSPKPEFVLSLPVELRRLLINYYDKPKDAELLPVEELKETDHEFTEGEQDIHRLLPLLMVYTSQDNIKLTSKNRPVNSTIGKLRRKMEVQEFFPEAKERLAQQARSNLLAGMLVTLSQNQLANNAASSLRDSVFGKNYRNRFESAPIILSHLKGMGYVDTSDLQDIEKDMFLILQKLPLGEWVDMENIATFLRYNLIEVEPIDKVTAANKLYYQYRAKEERYYTDKHYVRKDIYNDAIAQPFLKGTLFFFASFGLLDLKYDEPDLETLGVTAYSPYDGLKYVRLTPLGAYVSGVTNNYEIPKQSAPPTMKLSPDSLTILVDSDTSIADTLLAPYATRISPSRFQTDFNTFLKECNDQYSIDNKIKLFKQFVGEDLPENWQAFFKELRQKIEPLELIGATKIFQIPADNSDLIRLIARDAELRDLTIKAENYHILIKNSDLNKFKKRLQKFGYFMS